MTESLDTTERAIVKALQEIPDDVERYQAAKEYRIRTEQLVKEIQAEVARNLHDGRSWGDVGKLLGVTGSRAEQISRGSR